MARVTIKGLGKVLIVAFKDFSRNEPLRLAGATAFFTTFALPPILIILVQIIGIVFGIQNLREKFITRLALTLGKQSAAQVQVTFAGFTSLAKNWFITVGGFIFLMFVATTLFKVIKDSINQLWSVRAASQKPLRIQIANRAVSMIIILIAGILFIGGILAEGFEALIRHYTLELPSLPAYFLNMLIKQLVSVIIVTTWFSILFKVLPDARTSWKVVIAGGLFTGLLFTAGKIIIRYMLAAGNISNIFGASSSLVLLLLFVFYSSFILYYGACFTKVYATFIQQPIQPAEHAVKYKMVEIKSTEL